MSSDWPNVIKYEAEWVGQYKFWEPATAIKVQEEDYESLVSEAKIVRLFVHAMVHFSLRCFRWGNSSRLGSTRISSCGSLSKWRRNLKKKRLIQRKTVLGAINYKE